MQYQKNGSDFIAVHEAPAISYILLSYLKEQTSSGYDLKQRLDKELPSVMTPPAKSQVYMELKRLCTKGWASVEEIEQTHRPDKRLYSITEAGNVALQQWFTSADQPADSMRSQSMARFIRNIEGSPAELCNLIHQRLDAIRQDITVWKAAEESLHKELALGKPNPLASKLRLMALDRAVLLCEADLEWCEHTLELLTPPKSAKNVKAWKS